MTSCFHWPLHCLPEIRLGGRFPFSRANCDWEYIHCTYAIHQHHYPARLRIGKLAVAIRPGDVTISPPETVSRYDLQGDGYHWCVHFLPATAAQGAPRFRLPLHLPMHGGGGLAGERLRLIAETLDFRRPKTRKGALAEAAAGTLLQELLLSLALDQEQKRPTRPYRRKADGLLDAARERLDQGYREAISAADLARESGLSRNYFSARFRERFGMTVDGYLLHRRIEMARLLLHSTSRPIKEIAFECGIADPGYFNKQFRKAVGVSPSAFRAQKAKDW